MSRTLSSPEPPRASLLTRFARRGVRDLLRLLDHGEIRLTEAEHTDSFGRPCAEFPQPIELEILSPDFYRSVAFGGTVGGGESFIREEWRCSDLAGLLRLILSNRAMRRELESGLARWANPLRRALHALRRNGRNGSRRNISAHYDLGNDFFEQFLDPTMTYSAGIFSAPQATMEQASLEKYEHICKAVDLRAGDHLLEIGTGWGGFALYAAKTRGCRVTTTTISRAQHEWATRRVREEGLEDRIDLLLSDYRDLEGQFDKLVSIEMIEAVGHQYFETFFRVCDARLAPHGRAALQCIVIDDDHYERATRTVDFIKRYIFPGGCLPSLRKIEEWTETHTAWAETGREDITADYAETLRRWRARLLENADAIRRLGYPEERLRMWEFYFAYCEAGFEERTIETWQLAFEKTRLKTPYPSL